MAIAPLVLNEGQVHEITLSFDATSVGKTIDVYMTQIDATSGVEVGTTAGVAADTQTTFDIDTSSLAIGFYYMEIFFNFTADKDLIYPEPGNRFVVEIQNVKAF